MANVLTFVFALGIFFPFYEFKDKINYVIYVI